MISDLGAHISITFYSGGGPLQKKGIERCDSRSKMISDKVSHRVQNSLILSQFAIGKNSSGKKRCFELCYFYLADNAVTSGSEWRVLPPGCN